MSTYLVSGTVVKSVEYEYSEIEVEADSKEQAEDAFDEEVENDYSNSRGSELDSFVKSVEITDIEKVEEEYEVVVSFSVLADDEEDAQKKVVQNYDGSCFYSEITVEWVGAA